MASFSLKNQPEVFLSHAGVSQAISRAVAAGRARKLAPRLYTTNTEDPPGEIVRRNRWQVADLLYPGAVVSHRTALDGGPTTAGVDLTDAGTIQSLYRASQLVRGGEKI